MSSLSTVAQDEREIVDEAQTISVTRTADGASTLVDYEIRGFTSPFGGQLVSAPTIEVPDPWPKQIGSDVEIKFNISVSEGFAGDDYVIEYTVDDGTTETDYCFFVQNGVYSAADAGNLTFRASAELERLSGTFEDDRSARELTDFSDTSRRGTGEFVFISDSSTLDDKHGDEPIPYFEDGNSLTFPAEAFSSRDSTAIIALQWNPDQGKDYPVAELTQGGNTYLEVRNEQGDVELLSDFAASSLYRSNTYSRDSLSPDERILIAEARIDTNEGMAAGSVNREITESDTTLQAVGFSSGTTELVLDPAGEDPDLKLLDVLTYDESIPTTELDRVARQLTYFYQADLVSPEQITTEGAGSPRPQSHVFYDSDVGSTVDRYNDTIERYDMYTASDPIIRLDPGDPDVFDNMGNLIDPTEPVWTLSEQGTAIAVDGRERAAAGTVGGDVLKLDYTGTPIWTFSHGGEITATELGQERYVYSASTDGTVKKIGEEGSAAVWSFGDHTGAVNDLALYQDRFLYTAGEDETVYKIDENDRSIIWSMAPVSSPVVAVDVSPSERVFAAYGNGELRVINSSNGNVQKCYTPFDQDLSSGTPISDLAVRSDTELYLVAGDFIKKIDPTDGSEYWKQDVFGSNPNKTAELDAVAVSPNGNVFAAENLEHNVIEFDGGDGSKVSEFSVSGDIHDLSVQPGTVEPHWR